MKKRKTCRFGSGKWFWLSIIAQYAVAGKRSLFEKLLLIYHVMVVPLG